MKIDPSQRPQRPEESTEHPIYAALFSSSCPLCALLRLSVPSVTIPLLFLIS